MVIAGKEPAVVRTSDISTAGVGLLVSDPLAAGLKGHVAFDMYFNGKSHPVKAEVQVKHCVFGSGVFKVGFLFVRIDSASTAAIAEFFRQT